MSVKLLINIITGKSLSINEIVTIFIGIWDYVKLIKLVFNQNFDCAYSNVSNVIVFNISAVLLFLAVLFSVSALSFK